MTVYINGEGFNVTASFENFGQAFRFLHAQLYATSVYKGKLTAEVWTNLGKVYAVDNSSTF